MPETIKLASRLDYTSVHGLIEELMNIPPDDTVHLDATDVMYFGSLCAQTIIAAARRFSETGGRMEIHNLTQRASDQLAAMGLSPAVLMEGRI